MTAFEISGLAFLVVFGGALAAVKVQSYLPDHHRDADTRAIVQLIMALVATMAGLLLSLLVASSHTFYDTQQSEVQQLAVNILLLDDVLAHYGPETAQIRALLKDDVRQVIQTISPVEGVGSVVLAPSLSHGLPKGVGLLELAQGLTPANSAQTFDQAAALTLMTEIANARLLIHEQSMSALPTPLFVVMVVWLVLLFFGFGLFARANPTIIAAMFCGALSVAAAVFLIVDMSRPYSGLTRVSAAPMQNALMQIDH